MYTEMSDNVDRHPERGWVLYDANCSFCTALMARTKAAIEAGGFRYEPLQTASARHRPACSEEQLLSEMHVLTVDGRVIGGADALVYVARGLNARHRPWWSWLLVVVSKAPLGMPVLRRAYRWVAVRRYCRQGVCRLTTPEDTKKEEKR